MPTTRLANSVYIVSNTTLGADRMFAKRGWKVYRDWDKPDPKALNLICFTGGADLNPSLYQERPHKYTHWIDKRDELEVTAYTEYVGKVPMAGICRGGQLLNVMNGGKLYQHVNNHGGGNHPITDIRKPTKPIMVSSCHHQMMIPPPDKGRPIAWAALATVKETHDEVIRLPKPDFDVEVIVFDDEKHLAVQFHPEFGPRSCEDYFFELIGDYCGVSDSSS